VKSIILEGPNGAGKSTLAKRLSEELGLEIIHAGGPSDDFKHCIKRSMEELGKINTGTYIFDRVQPPSYMVYQQPNSLDMKLLKSILDKMLWNSILIYCHGDGTPDFDNKEHYVEGLQEEVTINQVEIRKRYKSLMNILPHVSYHFGTDLFDTLLKEVKNDQEK